jgi:hypothetical protein
MAKLEVQIGADASELEKEIKKVEKELKELSNKKLEDIKLGLDTKTLDGEITSTKKKLNDLKTTVKDAGVSFDKMAPKVANGGNSLMQFSRIVQDAPFGIMGIGNNITATAEAFGHLKQETGSTSGAFKAMASSLMGSGGILLAISLLTTGLTYLSQSGLSVGDLIDKLTGNFNEFGESVKKASEEGAKSAGVEIAQLKALVSVAKNENLSKKERLIAVNELQSRYPAYFGNLKKEQILTGNVTSEVKELTAALVARATAEKLASDSAEIQLAIFKANANLIRAKNKVSDEEKKIELQLAKAKSINGTSESQLAIIRARGIHRINEYKESEKEARDEIIKNTKALENYSNVINSLTAKSIKLDFKETKVKKAKVVEKQKRDPITQTLVLKPILDPSFFPDKLFDTGKLDEFGNKIQQKAGEIVAPLLDIPRNFDTSMDDTLLLLQQFNEEANAIILGSITGTFNNLGNAIGTALASGQSVVSAIGGSLLASLGNFLSDMGSLLIKYGVLAVTKGKLDLAMKSFGALSIGAGIAAIAVGVALKGVGASMASRANGGSSSGSGSNYSTGANYSSPAISGGSYSSNSNNSGRVVFEISGQSLVGVLGNTLDKNRRLGGL